MTKRKAKPILMMVVMLLLIGVLMVIVFAKQAEEHQTVEKFIIINSSCETIKAHVNAELETCKTTIKNLGILAEGYKEKYAQLIAQEESERLARSEYRQVLQECYNKYFEFRTSGQHITTMCPTCDYRSDCSSQSMMPLFNCKSTVEFDKVRSESDIQVCDVIVFNRPSGIGLVHRVWKVYKDADGVTRYKTAGDNSQQFDAYNPRFSDIIGEVAGVTTK